MGWCPSCKNEFVAGIEICPKCDVPLVASLDEVVADEAKSADNKKVIDWTASEKKQANGDYDPNAAKDMSGSYSMSALPMLGSTGASAGAKGNAASEAELEEIEKQAQARRAMAVKKAGAPQVYQDKNEKAKEVKGSAFALILVGLMGIVFVGLVAADVIQLNQSPTNKIMFCGAIFVMFLVLTIMGFLSIKSFKLLEKSASEEDQLSNHIEKWYKEKLSAEIIDNAMAKFIEPDEPEEEKYFKRIAFIKAVLTENFVNLDNLYVDHIVEEIYSYFYD